MTIAGFVPKPRTRTVECAWLEPAEGAEPLTATIVVNLSLEQIDYVNQLRASNPTYSDLWAVICPQVIAWNAHALDMATGDYVPVPPPAEIGQDALRAVDPLITSWLAWELGRSHLGGAEREGKSKPSDDTQSSDGDDSSISALPNGTKTPKSRSRRKD